MSSIYANISVARTNLEGWRWDPENSTLLDSHYSSNINENQPCTLSQTKLLQRQPPSFSPEKKFLIQVCYGEI